MQNVEVITRDSRSNPPIKYCVLDPNDIEKVGIIIKNNTILNIEEFGQDGLQLNGVDLQVLTSAFLLAHKKKEEGINFDANTVFSVPLEAFCRLWGHDFTIEVKRDGNIYRDVINSVSRLNQRIFRYPDIKGDKFVESGYFAYIKYNNTVIEFGFPLPIIDYIWKMNDFTWYFLENILKLQDNTTAHALKNYATILYENIQKEKNLSIKNNAGEAVMQFRASKLRKLMGLEAGAYERHIDFRKKILDRCVAVIKKRVGLSIRIDNVYVGRSVESYRFYTKFNERDLDFRSAVARDKNGRSIMTGPQRDKFSKLLIEHGTFDSMYRQPQEDDPSFAARISNALRGNEKLIEFESYLRAVGYKSKKFNELIRVADEAILENSGQQKQATLDLGDGDVELRF